MCPEFFHIGPIAIRAYGVALALSFFIGLALLSREARHLRINPDRAVNLGFVLILFGVLGARLAYAFYHWSDFADNPLDIINPFGSVYFGISGLNLQGGLILGAIAGYIYLRWKKMPLLTTLDAAAPAVAFGIFLSRIGCFLNGCCFGTPTDSFLGVQFPEDSYPWYVFGEAHLHPAQLYSSAYGLLLFFLLRRVNRKWQRAGLATGLFFMIEAAFRFAIEGVRYYENAMYVDLFGAHVTFNHLAAISLFLVGVVVLAFSRPRETERGLPAAKSA
jgi:phosphatidylglycerol:prolipoprotein diacylglycerol transferase